MIEHNSKKVHFWKTYIQIIKRLNHPLYSTKCADKNTKRCDVQVYFLVKSAYTIKTIVKARHQTALNTSELSYYHISYLSKTMQKPRVLNIQKT